MKPQHDLDAQRRTAPHGDPLRSAPRAGGFSGVDPEAVYLGPMQCCGQVHGSWEPCPGAAASVPQLAQVLAELRAFVARTEQPDPERDPELAALPRDRRLAESALALPYAWVVALLAAQSQALGLAEWLEEAARRGDPARAATLRADLVAALTGGAS